MNEHPILFSTEMVQAILTGRKTQTRRVVKSELIIEQAEFECGNRPNVIQSEPSLQYWTENSCPFGQVGDRIWVRETHAFIPKTAYRASNIDQIINPNDQETVAIFKAGFDLSQTGIKWKPSIHMPRWASRLQLEITNIRIERLNDISEDDAIAEGMIADDDYCAEEYFSKLWNEINGWDEKGWNANPWVWVVEFKVIQGGAS